MKFASHILSYKSSSCKKSFHILLLTNLRQYAAAACNICPTTMTSMICFLSPRPPPALAVVLDHQSNFACLPCQDPCPQPLSLSHTHALTLSLSPSHALIATRSEHTTQRLPCPWSVYPEYMYVCGQDLSCQVTAPRIIIIIRWSRSV